MGVRGLRRIAEAMVLWVVMAVSALCPVRLSSMPAAASPQTPSGFDAASVPVYIGELELHAVTKPADRLPDPPPSPDAPLAKPAYTEEETPAKLARLLVRNLQGSLVQAFGKLGYKAETAIGPRPGQGVEIRGVFAEPDSLNRIRRAILGAGSPNSKLVLYLGAVNLAKPEQPFYQVVIPNPAVPNSDDPRFGPVLTISAYMPVGRFELDRNPTSDALDKAAEQMAAQVDALIRRNALAVTRP